MNKKLASNKWKAKLPIPVYDKKPEYNELYYKAWEIARDHIKFIPGMPTTPYMDEGFCDTQIWIWDSCFMALFTKYAQNEFPGKETLNNFYEVLYGDKTLPEIIPTENEPQWTGAVPGVPYKIKIHIADNPPLFALAEYENAIISGDKTRIKTLLYDNKYLEKHYEWIEGLTERVQLNGVKNETRLIREKNGYKWEGGRSGMDNTPRGKTGLRAEVERPNNPDMLWIDAICQQALSARMISKLFTILSDEKNASLWNERYSEKRSIVNKLYWDGADGFYYDIDSRTSDFYKVKTPASYWALVSKIASAEQAAQMVKYIESPLHFGGDLPLISLSKSDPDYNENGNYWRGSLWLPTAYATLKGLCEYGFFKTARNAATKIFEHQLATYREYDPHTIWEAYSPSKFSPATNETGTKTVRPDFCGWSALGPISVYIEHILGFYKIDGFEKCVYWNMPHGADGNIGIKNLCFGSIVADIIYDGKKLRTTANSPFTLIINDERIDIPSGKFEKTI